MKKKLFIKRITLLALLLLLVFCFAACAKKDTADDAADTETPITESEEITQDFIIVGENEGNPLIFYNLNYVTSVDELAEYVDLVYDFDKKPEIILAEVDAPEGVFEQVKAMLDEKGVVYVITEDEE